MTALSFFDSPAHSGHSLTQLHKVCFLWDDFIFYFKKVPKLDTFFDTFYALYRVPITDYIFKEIHI